MRTLRRNSPPYSCVGENQRGRKLPVIVKVSKHLLLHGGRRSKGFGLALDDVKKLIDAGKEKGYLAYKAVKR